MPAMGETEKRPQGKAEQQPADDRAEIEERRGKRRSPKILNAFNMPIACAARAISNKKRNHDAGQIDGQGGFAGHVEKSWREQADDAGAKIQPKIEIAVINRMISVATRFDNRIASSLPLLLKPA